MSSCRKCGARLTVGPSAFPGYDLLACEECGRPVKLIVKGVPRPHGGTVTQAGVNRAMRAARREKLKRTSR